ncbi:response regulator transcription factor [Pseudonocardia sp. HH130629-09]|uniref:response regulator transcription factor n=1 Tax=Pseudonocardia sp. HH130629-09 TaxID=1641402 RepID=UPI0006CB1A16|nr:response regulator transcription factor [Pseudonocardia sp. HH130629-09]ALE85235.1 transcriptional regulator [Pseudonocardia sp. HH130629-09]
MSSRILVAEDEPRIASFVKKGLVGAGFEVTVVADGPGVHDHAVTGEFDLLVLDIGLPGMDGFEVLRRLRAAGSAVPVIILTARDSVHDTVAGLTGGADDYMAKPFRFEELVARIRLRLDRARAAPDRDVLTFHGLELDPRTRYVTVHGRTVELSVRECELAETFLRHPGQVLSRDQLLRLVWGPAESGASSNVVDVYVRYLRRKLGAGWIATVRGAGYRLEPG